MLKKPKVMCSLQCIQSTKETRWETRANVDRFCQRLTQNLTTMNLDFLLKFEQMQKSVGIDTTSLFKLMPPLQQQAHSFRVKPVQGQQHYGGWSDDHRFQRQFDVVVTCVSYLSEKRLRTDVNNNTGSIILTLNRKPKSVLVRNKDLVKADFEKILKYCSVDCELTG